MAEPMTNKTNSPEQISKTIGIVGGGKGGNEILKYISGIPSLRILYVIDVNPNAVAFESARKMGISVSTNLETILKSTTVDFIIEATGSRNVFNTIMSNVPQSTEILSSKSALLIFNMLDETRKLSNSRVKEDIEAIRTEIIAETKRVKNFLEDISGITVGMNILGLNASIEAAHSGSFGRGFGVVAKEIKAVAEKTRSLAKNIENINVSIVEMSSRIDTALKNIT